MKLESTFTPTKWDEVDYGPILDGTKTTKASIEYTFTGEMEGKGQVEYLMFYKSFDPNDMHAAEATFLGLIQFSGTLAGRSGTFTLQESGTFSGGVVQSNLEILEGSGIEGLKGIIGSGSARAGNSGAQWSLDIQI